jgi:hypothetical protein
MKSLRDALDEFDRSKNRILVKFSVLPPRASICIAGGRLIEKTCVYEIGRSRIPDFSVRDIYAELGLSQTDRENLLNGTWK